jgi:hypothetical protein
MLCGLFWVVIGCKVLGNAFVIKSKNPNKIG